ncbi:uncharacterized protein METZ01_LOCUS368214, partial [marine metagenome]
VTGFSTLTPTNRFVIVRSGYRQVVFNPMVWGYLSIYRWQTLSTVKGH